MSNDSQTGRFSSLVLALIIYVDYNRLFLRSRFSFLFKMLIAFLRFSNWWTKGLRDYAIMSVNNVGSNLFRLPPLHGLKLILSVEVTLLQSLWSLFCLIFFVCSNVFDNTRIQGKKQPF